MISKITIGFICFIAVGCMPKQQKKVVEDYDEQTLKAFVLSSHTIGLKDFESKLDSILNNASKDSTVFIKTISFLEKPFGDANSAYRNEDLYVRLLRAKIQSLWYDSSIKSSMRSKLFLTMQNRPGSAANDFTYITAAEFKKRMYDLLADFTILYFYNPQCEACKEMKAALINSDIIQSKVRSEKLKVLAVYTDKDEKIWLDHLKEMPEAWIHGRDENEYLNKNNVYDLKSIPTVYLLDKSKNVLLKDCMNVSTIEKELSLKE